MSLPDAIAGRLLAYQVECAENGKRPNYALFGVVTAIALSPEPIGLRAIARATGMTNQGALDALAICDRLRVVAEVRVGKRPKYVTGPMVNSVDRSMVNSLDHSTDNGQLSRPLSDERSSELTIDRSTELTIDDGTGVVLRAGDNGTFSSSPKEQGSKKPEEKKIHGGDPALKTAAPAVATGKRPRSTRAEIQARAAERREREAAAKAERQRVRDATRAAKAAAKARAAADTVPVELEIVAVQVVYRKIREVINCKLVSPSASQQVAALAFAREAVAARLEPGSNDSQAAILARAADAVVDAVARVLCDDLDNWRVDYYSGALGEMRSKKPHVGDLRNTFETSVMTRSGELARIAGSASPSVDQIESPHLRAAARLRAKHVRSEPELKDVTPRARVS